MNKHKEEGFKKKTESHLRHDIKDEKKEIKEDKKLMKDIKRK